MHRDPNRYDSINDAYCSQQPLQENILTTRNTKIGYILTRWSTPICNYHRAHHGDGITEAMNNLIKRIKRIGFGFTNFNNYKTRVLPRAGKPQWKTLNSITTP